MITSLLTREDGSAGRVKADRRPAPNRTHYWPADELNKVLDWAVAACAVLGLSDGSTADSILQKLRSVANLRGTRSVHAEDFLHTTVGASGALHTSSVVSSGTAALAPGEEVDSGAGHLKLTAANAVSSSAAAYASNTLNGGQLPDFRARFKITGTLAGFSMVLGLSEQGAGTYARFAMAAGGALSMEIESPAASSTSTPTGVSLALNTWYEARIRVNADLSADFWLNDVHLGNVPDNAPQISDRLAPFYAQISRSSGGPHTLVVDWYETSFDRL